MTALSLCMIVKDEENILEKFLNDIKPFVDEIIIVDTGSRDKTKEIAKRFTSKVYDHFWKDDFSEARNFSLAKATKGWILVLDADEKITKNGLIKIKKIINKDKSIKKPKFKNKKNDILGYSFLQKTYMNEEFPFKFVKTKDKNYAGYTYRRMTRLFRNDKRIRFEYPIHETVINSIMRMGGRINPLDINIDHYPLSKSKKDINDKNKLYLKLLKKKIKRYPEAKFYCELGMQYLLMKDRKEADKSFRKAAELNHYYSKFIV